VNGQYYFPKPSLSGSPWRGGFNTAESMVSNERRGEVFGTPWGFEFNRDLTPINLMREE
jgi:hypothetical protein